MASLQTIAKGVYVIKPDMRATQAEDYVDIYNRARAQQLQMSMEAAAQEASDARRSQVRTVDRSERIRTYNFPENRLSDHRVGYKSHNLDQILDGDLDGVIEACVEADQASRLAETGS